MTLAVIYARFSPRPDADDCDSTEKQIDRCIKYCEANGLDVFTALEDRDVTGGIFDRPGLIEALKWLDEDHVLVVDRVDRMTRDTLVGCTILNEVKAKGSRVIYADGSPSGGSPAEIFVQQIMMAVAELGRNQVRDWTRKSMAKKRKECRRISRHIPVGWELDPMDESKKTLKVNLTERLAILRICSRRAWTWKWKKIAKDVSSNVGLFRGKDWSPRLCRQTWEKHKHWACPKTGDPSLEPTCPI